MRSLALLLCCLFLQGGGQPLPLVIQNPSFENGTNGWNFGAGSGVSQVNGISYASAGYGSQFSQMLSVSPAQLQELPNGYYADGVYVLTFSVANYYPTYPGQYDVEVSFGSQQLCESYGWANANPQTVTIVCPSPQYLVHYRALPSGGPVQGSNPLTITFQANGWTLLFNNVSLTYQ